MSIEVPRDFAAQYREMSDTELLRYAATGGLVPEADAALRLEMKRREISAKDISAMRHQMIQGKLQTQVGSNPYSRGTGLRFRGDKSESKHGNGQNVAVMTRWIEFAYMPLIPIGSYKVMHSDDDGSMKVLGTAKFRWDQVGGMHFSWRQVMLRSSYLLCFGRGSRDRRVSQTEWSVKDKC